MSNGGLNTKLQSFIRKAIGVIVKTGKRLAQRIVPATSCSHIVGNQGHVGRARQGIWHGHLGQGTEFRITEIVEPE